MRGPSMDTRVTGSAPGVMQIIQTPTRWIGQPPAGVGGLVVAIRKIILAEEATGATLFQQSNGGHITWSKSNGLVAVNTAVLGGGGPPLIWGYMPVLPNGHLMIGRSYYGVSVWVAPFAAMLLRDAPTHSVAGHAATTLARLI